MKVAMGSQSCPSCGEEFSSISQHWGKSECDYPELSTEQQEALSALLVSGGQIQNKRQYTYTTTKSEDGLETLHKSLGFLSCGIQNYETSTHNSTHYRLSLSAHSIFDNGRPEPKDILDVPIPQLSDYRAAIIREYLCQLHEERDDKKLYEKLAQKNEDTSLLDRVLLSEH